MRLFNFGKKDTPKQEEIVKDNSSKEQPNSDTFIIGDSGAVFSPINPIVRQRFDGEKSTGQLGAVIDSVIDYKKLGYRANYAYLAQDTIKILVKRKLQFTIGEGLKLEVMPNKKILGLSGIEVEDAFYSTVEGYWSVYCDSVYFDYSRKRNFHKLAWEAKKAIINSGDVLVICRIEDNGPSIQLISGEFVETPPVGSEVLNQKIETNYIEHGVEIDVRGEHVAYYVKKRSKKDGIICVFEYERIAAVGAKTKKRLAWMVYGEKVCHDHERGVPEMTPILEKAQKMDRYAEAAVTKAEQAANLVYTIEHDQNSTGENPLKDLVNRKMGGAYLPEEQNPELKKHPWVLANSLAQQISEQTDGTVVNLPIGSKFHSFATDIESQYEPFESANFKKMSASMDMPSEVALHSYNSNYSASRAAINGASHMFQIDAKDFSDQFYSPIYKIWFEIMVLKNKIDAPGFIKALSEKDIFVIEAYTKAMFVGKKMPHIDPLKEANAIRKLLGDRTKGELPLISHEQAAEMANAGDWTENIEEYKEEILSNTVKDINDATTVTTEEPSNQLAGESEV